MIEIENLSKVYGGLEALSDVSLSIEAGDIFGYIGPNGAGKSTTFKILATLLRPSQGQAIIDGFSVTSQAGEVRKRIGYMPDVFGAYEDMTVGEYLEFFASLYDVDRARRAAAVDGVLDLTDLRAKKGADCHSLSRGMQQRLGLARVLLHDPKVLLLDEPASGLDPRARIEIRELLKELRNMGKTILISSHILRELSEIATRFGIIERGKLMFAGSPAELLAKVEHRRIYDITLKERPAEAQVALRGLDFVERCELTGKELEVELKKGRKDSGDVIAALIDKGFRPLTVQERQLDLEASFMMLTRGQVA